MVTDKIFISYARSDGSEYALKLYNDLRKAGANVWIDQVDIKGGKNWDNEIEKALNDSNYVLYLVTDDSVVSGNVLNEIFYAIDEKKEVVPILFTQSKINFRLNRLHRIDFLQDYNRGLTTLCRDLNLNISERLNAENTNSQNINNPVSAATFQKLLKKHFPDGLPGINTDKINAPKKKVSSKTNTPKKKKVAKKKSPPKRKR